MPFVLRDEVLMKPGPDNEAGKLTFKNLGKVIVLPDMAMHTKLDFTAPPGVTSGLYYSLIFMLGKWEWQSIKADEWLEVSPVHAQYYQLTKKQKEDLEMKIKEGLRSATQAVGDYELLLHDERKYKEFLNYLGLSFDGKEFVEDESKKDEISLKTIFIDQVDFHSGGTEGGGPGRLSMSFMRQRNIMPTIVEDFYAMENEDFEKNDRFKDLPDVEKNMLKVKWRAYQQWKQLFVTEIKNRYRRIYQLVQSREKSVEQYREWLKPYIAKHKMLEEGLGRENIRKRFSTDTFHSNAQSTSESKIMIWAWKDVMPYELQRVPGEYFAKKPVDPYSHSVAGKFLKEKLIYDKEIGLISSYPWISKDWVEKNIKELMGKYVGIHKHYYSFILIDMTRLNLKLASGSEVEDMVFELQAILMTHNALLAKLLEWKAKEQEHEDYVNQMLGIHERTTPAVPIEKKDGLKSMKSAVGKLGFSMPLVFRRGPYDTNFSDRITKIYLRRQGSDRYLPIVNFIKTKMGWGVS